MPKVRVKAWQRQSDESSCAFDAFVLYRDMPQRSNRQVGETLKKNKSQIDLWSSKHAWVARCRAWDNELDKRVRHVQVQEIKAMKRRQIRMAVEMQSVAGAALKSLTEKLNDQAGPKSPVSPDHIVRLVDIGSRLERLNRDEPEQNMKLLSDQDYSNLTIEEMEQLRNLLQRSCAS